MPSLSDVHRSDAHNLNKSKTKSNSCEIISSSMNYTTLSNTLLLWLTLWAACAQADTTTSEPKCDATYSVRLAATYPNDVAVTCTPAELDLITQVIHSVVEIDTLTSRIGKYVPKFEMVSEMYGDNAIIDPTGELAPPLDAEEIVKHLTEEDLKEDIYYANGAPHDEGDDRRYLRELINGEVDPLLRDDLDFLDSASIEIDQAHRQAQLMDCDGLGDCSADWCCQICGYCWGRRLESDNNNDNDSDSDSKRLRAAKLLIQEDNTTYLQQIKQHEERVSAEIESKMRYMARKETVPCLGNFWQVQVFYKLIL